MKLLLIDNNDSFTFNIVNLLKQFKGINLTVTPSNQVKLEQVPFFNKVIYSPGPGLPNDFPIMFQILERYQAQISLLGICLGHQTIGQFFGGRLYNLPQVYHGQIKPIRCDQESKLFNGLPCSFNVGVYHSWVVDNPLPSTLKITASSSDKLIMGLSHITHDIHGVQFHPESFISEYGKEILSNFIYG